MKFDERLKQLRIEKGLSEKELAEELMTTETTVRLWEKGKLDVNLEMLEKLAEYFDVSTKFLLGTVMENLPPEEAVQSYRIARELSKARQQEKMQKMMQEAAIDPPRQTQPAEDSPVESFTLEDEFQTLHASTVAVYSKISGSDPAEWVNFIEDYWPIGTAITNMYGNDLNNYFYLRVDGDRMKPTLLKGEVVLVRKQSSVHNNEVAVLLCDWGESIIARVTHTPDKIVLYFDNQAYPAQVYDSANCLVLGKVLWKSNAPQ
ncbi:helix-turn-helix domain-containing protein [Syntrophomonas palmitatica]|uniref:helix-turn-helix domain-containing protein n=1 Tax=Syntrophomonas palmitatica TaxID=402877 RepID=UPI0006D1A42B|nr:XRE family transcriptional regulator [Syntrophomonas palmitatica]